MLGMTEEFEKVGQAKYKSSVEKYIVRNCDHVTAVSKPLATKLGHYEPMNPVRFVRFSEFLTNLQMERKFEG